MKNLGLFLKENRGLKFFTALYLLSMFMPAGDSYAGTVPGFGAYLYSYLSFMFLEKEFILMAFGCLSNVYILVMFIRLIKAKFVVKAMLPKDKAPSMFYFFAFPLTILSVAAWVFTGIKVYIGYYVWAVASIGIVFNLFFIIDKAKFKAK